MTEAESTCYHVTLANNHMWVKLAGASDYASRSIHDT